MCLFDSRCELIWDFREYPTYLSHSRHQGYPAYISQNSVGYAVRYLSCNFLEDFGDLSIFLILSFKKFVDFGYYMQLPFMCNLKNKLIKSYFKVFRIGYFFSQSVFVYEASFCIMRLKRFFEHFKIIKIILYKFVKMSKNYFYKYNF